MADQIRYDLLTQQALRGVVRGVLADAACSVEPGRMGGGAGYCPRVRKVYYDVRLSP